MIDPTPVIDASRHETLLSVLAYERRLLERLLVRHTELAMLLEAGEHRFIARALDEVAEVETELGVAETIRAAIVEALVPDTPEPSFDDVLFGAPAGVALLLHGLRLDLRRRHDDIEARRHAARGPAARRAGMAAKAQATLRSIGYRSDGSTPLDG